MTTQTIEPEYEILDPLTGKVIEDKAQKSSDKDAKPEKDAASKMEDEFQLPDKFKGKSAEEIAKSYVDLEQLQSRQSQELGELRKSHTEMQKQVGEIVQRELEQSRSSKEASKMEEDLEYDDLIDNPTSSIKKVVSKDLDDIKKELESFKTQNALDKFVEKHPDYMDITQDLEFQGWISDSPYRQRMFVAADRGDLVAADDLFSEWKSRKKISTKEQASEREKALKGVKTESSGATSGSAKKKMYRRSDLINLRINSPELYDQKANEFRLAYAEGRVIDDI